ncbi:MAG: 1-deoxy-D-xylulose-5-phosphate synthase [Deltaproteobacteria bacterium]|nr:1-deoxy-D-xylulose-5-phosphate synthase [Deltaproteobacteria bacterium]
MKKAPLLKETASERKLLPNVNYPNDIKHLSLPELNALATEIRSMIIETVSRRGGHLASSLGAVELTMALHYVFNTPQDKLIWDVGHQTYAHKILTGRREKFDTLRQKDGLSGFPKREESVYDVFNVGHSGTSISAAAGIAEAGHLQGSDFKTVVIIGDGSMSAGMAFEGLNWVGDRKKDLIIVLNDNELSISPNVGALSSYLNRIMTGHTVTRLKSEFKNFLKSIPTIGEPMFRFTRQIEESLKAFVVPGLLFEELGFTYVGPLEGHRLDHLIKNLDNVKHLRGPVLVHVITKKGKGYHFSENDPLRFHGIAPFHIETGEDLADRTIPVPPSYTRVFGETLVKLATDDERIVAITAAMCEGTGLDKFAKKFPARFFDVGIAEQHAVTFAAGLATQSLLPVVAIYSTFLQRSYDQIIHDVCLQKLPVVFALDRGGLVGEDGATHHGIFDYAFLRSIPNIVVMAPKDENELQHMLITALQCGYPASIRYPRGHGIGVAMDEAPRVLRLGGGEVLATGSDLAIFAIGACVYPALQAAAALLKEGISITVVNARFVKPLDEQLLCDTALSVSRVLTVEENVLMGGFGSAVLELFESRGIRNVQVRRLGIRDAFVEHATQRELRSMCGIDEEGICAAIRQMMRDE